MTEMRRNYRVVGLSNAGTVLVEIADPVAVIDTGERPSEFGLWGLRRREAAILRRGMTRGGRDRRPR